MSVTANELLERLPPPAVIQNFSRSMEQRLSRGAGSAAEVTDPTPVLREFLDRLRVMQEELGTLSVESDEDRAFMREEAAATGRIARVYHDLHTEMIESGPPRFAPLGGAVRGGCRRAGGHGRDRRPGRERGIRAPGRA